MRIGIDLGGHKIEIIALSDQQEELYRKRIASPRDDYDATVRSIRNLVSACETSLGRQGTIGIGIPGTLSKLTGLVKNANSTHLIGKPFQQDLEAAFGRAVRLANDANCFALSEAVDGAAQGHDVVFGVILGTGTGAGLVVNGQVIEGPNGVAGEWGHNPMPWPVPEDGPPRKCYCGQSGCIETLLSGPALAHLHHTLTGEDKTAADICAEDHETTFRLYEHRLARALAHVINILDPDVIVLGGGLSNMARWYERVPELWAEWVFGGEVTTRLRSNIHGDSSGVRGAAWLWPQA